MFSLINYIGTKINNSIVFNFKNITMYIVHILLGNGFICKYILLLEQDI